MDRKRILLIDDELDFGKIVKMNLELLDNSFEIVLATNGKEGIKKAARLKPDLILLDILMPHLDGNILEAGHFIPEDIQGANNG